jgi:prepilin signal peptidase PulO-like enzyme (type II secretory pathway)
MYSITACVILFIIIWIDWKRSIVPLPLVVALGLNGLIIHGFLLHHHWQKVALGALVGFGIFAALLFLFKKSENSIDWGDVWLATAIGMNVGSYDLIRVIALAAAQGIVVWLVISGIQRVSTNPPRAIPFGALLALGAFEVEAILAFF